MYQSNELSNLSSRAKIGETGKIEQALI